MTSQIKAKNTVAVVASIFITSIAQSPSLGGVFGRMCKCLGRYHHDTEASIARHDEFDLNISKYVTAAVNALQEMNGMMCIEYESQHKCDERNLIYKLAIRSDLGVDFPDRYVQLTTDQYNRMRITIIDWNGSYTMYRYFHGGHDRNLSTGWIASIRSFQKPQRLLIYRILAHLTSVQGRHLLQILIDAGLISNESIIQWAQEGAEVRLAARRFITLEGSDRNEIMLGFVRNMYL